MKSKEEKKAKDGRGKTSPSVGAIEKVDDWDEKGEVVDAPETSEGITNDGLADYFMAEFLKGDGEGDGDDEPSLGRGVTLDKEQSPGGENYSVGRWVAFPNARMTGKVRQIVDHAPSDCGFMAYWLTSPELEPSHRFKTVGMKLNGHKSFGTKEEAEKYLQEAEGEIRKKILQIVTKDSLTNDNIFDPEAFDQNSFEWGAIYWINKVREDVSGMESGYVIPDEQFIEMLRPLRKAARVYAEAHGKGKKWVKNTVLSVPKAFANAFDVLSDGDGVSKEHFLKVLTVEGVCALAAGDIDSVHELENYYYRKGIYSPKGGYKVGDFVVVLDEQNESNAVRRVIAIYSGEDENAYDPTLVFWNKKKSGVMERKASLCSKPFPNSGEAHAWLSEQNGEGNEDTKERTDSDRLDAILESVVLDADPEKSDPEFWAKHDKARHHGHFDPETMTCKLREKFEQGEKIENLRDEMDDIDVDSLHGNHEEVPARKENTEPQIMSQEEMDSLANLFGTTSNLEDAGWILPDGRLIDLKKAHRADEKKEHSELGKALYALRGGKDGDSSIDRVNYARESGAIRLTNFEGNVFLDIGRKPTKEQIDVLYDVADHKWGGGRHGLMHGIDLPGRNFLGYENDTELSRRMVNEIKSFFDNREGPESGEDGKNRRGEVNNGERGDLISDPDYGIISDVLKAEKERKNGRPAQLHQRVPEEALRGEDEDTRILREASLICRAVEGAGSAGEGDSGSGDRGRERNPKSAVSGVEQARETSRRQEAILEKYARKMGIWEDDAATALKESDDYDYIEGGESIAFFPDDPSKPITKVITSAYFPETAQLLDRIILHNYLFPSSKLEVKGFGRARPDWLQDGDPMFCVKVEQQQVDTSCPAKPEQIAEHMKNLGFHKHKELASGDIVWESNDGRYVVSDLTDENAFIDQDGTIEIIDANIQLNTPGSDGSGKYRLPPYKGSAMDSMNGIAADEICKAFGIVEDGGINPNDPQFWAKHDKAEHGGHFDPETQSCKLREELGFPTVKNKGERDEAKDREDSEIDDIGGEAPDVSDAEKEKEDAVDDIEAGDDVVASPIVTPEEDAAYMDAVGRGDMETAQRMVREAAARAMPDTKVIDEDGLPLLMYHGSTNKDIKVFDKSRIRDVDYDYDVNGFWFSDDPITSPAFGDAKKTYPVFLDVRNPIEYKDAKNIIKKIRDAFDKWYGDEETRPLRTSSRSVHDEVRARLQDMGYDGVITSKHHNVTEDMFDKNGEYHFVDASGSRMYLKKSDNPGWYDLYSENQLIGFLADYKGLKDFNTSDDRIITVFEPNQIKSADPVTYDDDGNVIPLSKRFNPEEEDIRYSRSEAEGDEADLEALREASRMYEKAIIGTKVEVHDRKYDPEVDADEGMRESISGIYTGSAADYDSPSIHAVGTGEGAQVYGWGLYGSTVRGVAADYATADAGRKRGRRTHLVADVKYDGKPIRDIDELRSEHLGLIARLEDYGSIDKVMESYEFFDQRGKLRESEKRDYEFLKENKEHFSLVENAPLPEYLYEQTFFTDRAPGDESHLLKWYDAISDANWDRVIAQAEKEGLRDKLKGAWWLRFNGDLEHFITDNGNSGDAIYERLSKMLGSPKAASEFLARAGIDGVKYPVDSYGKTVKDGDEAGWNYVSFRDDNIRVNHKWVDGKQMFMFGKGGKVVGTYNRETQKVDLYKGATIHTLVHELGGHTTMQVAEQYAQAGNKVFLDKINEAIDNAPKALWEEVRGKYGKGANETPQDYERRLRDEVWAAVCEGRSRAITDAKKDNSGRSWWRRAWNTAKACWAGVMSRMGLQVDYVTNKVKGMGVNEFTDFVVGSIRNGETLGSIKRGGTGIRQSFIGENGAKKLGIGNLNQAVEMEKAGADREEIWRKTGWWRGKEGKWRVEIPSISEAAARDVVAALRSGQDVVRLGDIAEAHAEIRDLIKAYPNLASLEFSLTSRGSSTNATGEFIELNDRFKPVSEWRNTIGHEIQHAIQVQEGFAKGGRKGSFAWLGGQRPFAIKEYKNLKRQGFGKEANYEDSFVQEIAGDLSYMNMAGEVEARNDEPRFHMTPAERANTPPWETEDVPESEQHVLISTEHKMASPERDRRSKTYGVPYQGSKNRIAKDIVSALPDGKRFVDLFSGGGAMTHAAMESGKFKSYRMNDKDGVGQRLFLEGARGDWDGYDRKSMTPEEFAAIKGTPEALAWSFNGLGRNLAMTKEGGRDRAREQIRRVQGLSSLKDQIGKVKASESDYRDVKLRPGDVVYADIPYENTDTRGYRKGMQFNKAEFVDWAQKQDVPVYVSEYTMPEGWTEIASFGVPGMRGGDRTEKLFVQSRFANEGKRRTGSAIDSMNNIAADEICKAFGIVEDGGIDPYGPDFWMKHDKAKHGGHFDPETMTCKLREKMGLPTANNKGEREEEDDRRIDQEDDMLGEGPEQKAVEEAEADKVDEIDVDEVEPVEQEEEVKPEREAAPEPEAEAAQKLSWFGKVAESFLKGTRVVLRLDKEFGELGETENEDLRLSVKDIARLTYKMNEQDVSLKTFAQTFQGYIKQGDTAMEDVERIAGEYLKAVKEHPEEFMAMAEGDKMSHMRYLYAHTGDLFDPDDIRFIGPEDSIPRQVYSLYKDALDEDTFARMIELLGKGREITTEEKKELSGIEAQAHRSDDFQSALALNAEKINDERKKKIHDLIQYFEGNDDYTLAEKALIVNGAMRYGISERMTDNGLEVKTVSLGDNNEAQVPVVGGALTAMIVERLRNGEPYKKAIVEAVYDMRNLKATERGVAPDFTGWKVYSKDDSYEAAEELQKAVAGTGWCTGGAVSTAQMHRGGGDFHVWFKDGEPKIAIRTTDGSLAEPPRGTLPGQFCTSEEEEIAEKYIREGHGIVAGDAYFRDMEDIKKVQSGNLSWQDALRIPSERRYENGEFGGDTKAWPKPMKDEIERVIRAHDAERKAAKWFTKAEIMAFPELQEQAECIINRDNSPVQIDFNSDKLKEIIGGEADIREGASCPALERVGGDADIREGASVPALMSVGGDASIYAGASCPALERVGEGASIGSGASCPVLVSIGGYANILEGASVPALASIGGHASIYAGASCPVLASVDGNATIYPGASCPALASVGGDAHIYKGASVPALERVGGYASIYRGASVPALASVGGDAYIFAGASCPVLVSIGGYANILEGASVPALASIGGHASIYAGASCPVLASVDGNATIYPGASVPALASIGGHASIYAGASVPALMSIGGKANIEGGALCPALREVDGKPYQGGDGSIRALRTSSGKVVGTYDRGSNTVTLYKGADVHTLVHEMGGHATMQFAEQCAKLGNSVLMDKINEAIDSAPQTLKDYVKARYPNMSSEVIRDEIWAAVCEGRSREVEFARKSLEGRSWWNRAWRTAKACFSGVLARMGIRNRAPRTLSSMTPQQFTDYIVSSIKSGHHIGDMNRPELTRDKRKW